MDFMITEVRCTLWVLYTQQMGCAHHDKPFSICVSLQNNWTEKRSLWRQREDQTRLISNDKGVYCVAEYDTNKGNEHDTNKEYRKACSQPFSSMGACCYRK